MSIADKLTTVAENVPKVYEAGKINFGRKKSVSGEALHIDDINPNKHKVDVNLTSDTITDFSSVNVTACGKNLFDIENAIADTDYLIVDGIVESTCATWVSARLFKNDTKFYIPKGTYRISADVYKTSEKVQTLGVRLSVAINNSISETYAQSAGKNLTNYDTWERLTAPIVIENDSLFTGILIQSTGTSGTDKDCGLFFKNVQIEYADTSTPYEPYNGTTYTPSADGTVEGVTSISPIMNIFTDAGGVIINADYYQDVERFNEDSGQNLLWNMLLTTTNNHEYRFRNVDFTGVDFNPPTTIYPLYGGYMFGKTKGLKKLTKEQVDFSKCIGFNYAFSDSGFEELDVIDFRAVTSDSLGSYVFSGSSSLRKINKIILPDTGKPFTARSFVYLYALEDITFEGVIGGDSISFEHSTKLNKKSITNIISVLSDTDTGYTLTLSSTAVTNAFGSTTADEWTALVATKQNWTISLV